MGCRYRALHLVRGCTNWQRRPAAHRSVRCHMTTISAPLLLLISLVAGITWLFVHHWRKARRLGRRYREATNAERAALEDEIAKNPDLANYMRPQPIVMIVFTILSVLIGVRVGGWLFS